MWPSPDDVIREKQRDFPSIREARYGRSARRGRRTDAPAGQDLRDLRPWAVTKADAAPHAPGWRPIFSRLPFEQVVLFTQTS